MGRTGMKMEGLVKDLVCTSLNNGARVPLLGYSPIFTSTKGSSLETALEAGYRQFVLSADPANDHLIGTIIKQWYRAGKVTRDDLFFALKIDASKIKKVTTNISQRLHDLNCGYLDTVILTNTESEDIDTLIGKWKTLEKVVETGYSRSLGIAAPPPDVMELDTIISRCSIKPAVLLVDASQDGALSKLTHLQRYTKYKAMQLLLVVSLDDISNQLHGGIKGFSSYVFKYNRSPSQILVRYFVQKGLTVICESGESQTTKNSFKVLDFLLDGPDMVNIGKVLLKG